MVTETQIINGTVNQTILTTDPVTSFYLPLALVAVTSIIAIITFVYNRKAYHETKKSNDLLMLELQAKYTPRIAIHDSNIQYESDKTNVAKFKCKIRNVGSVTLSEIKIAHDIDTRKKMLEELIKKEKEIWENTREYDSAINPEVTLTDYNFKFKESSKKEIWITLWFKFKVLNESKELIYQIRFVDLQEVGHDPYSNEQIEHVRKKKEYSVGL